MLFLNKISVEAKLSNSIKCHPITKLCSDTANCKLVNHRKVLSV